MIVKCTGRIRFLFGCVILGACILVVKLYLVQIVHGETFALRADRQYVRPQHVVYDRGSIFFETKEGERLSAATLQSGFILALNPSAIIDPEGLYTQLSPIIELDEEDFMERARRTDDPYEEVAKEITETQAQAIEALDLEGARLFRERWRFYPGRELASQVLGFVGYKGDERSGRYGLERYYNDVLSRDEDTTYVNFFAEIFSNVKNVLGDEKYRGKGDIVLTIEPQVQAQLEKKLREVEEEWSAKSAGGIVIDPQTGQIRAMGTTQGFDPNNFGTYETKSFTNPLVESVREMGSIIKPLTMAIGLDTGAVTANTTYEDRGRLTLNTYTIANYDGKARGVVPMQEVLNQSLNTGVAFVTSKVGNERFADYMRNFGIGEETGIDLPGEVRGLISNLESPRDIEYSTDSNGQGIAMTPIATVRALAALGNGGKLITPHVVKSIEHDLGYTKKIFYDDDKQVLKPETSEEISRMLVTVVDEALLGGTVKLDRHTIGAKTGTAQIAAPDGGYHDDRFFHSFFGYFPAFDPEYLIFLYVEEPREVRYASQTLTHPFMDLVKFLISYYEIPPDR